MLHQGRIDSVKPSPSLLMMRECEVFSSDAADCEIVSKQYRCTQYVTLGWQMDKKRDCKTMFVTIVICFHLDHNFQMAEQAGGKKRIVSLGITIRRLSLFHPQ